MRIIARKTLKEFWEKHPQAEHSLRAWFAAAQHADWTSPGSLIRDYPHASILANNRIVFNIKGNTFRLVVAVKFDFRGMYIGFIGTHAEYDKIDATKI